MNYRKLLYLEGIVIYFLSLMFLVLSLGDEQFVKAAIIFFNVAVFILTLAIVSVLLQNDEFKNKTRNFLEFFKEQKANIMLTANTVLVLAFTVAFVMLAVDGFNTVIVPFLSGVGSILFAISTNVQ